jgi:hypothetical protein
LPSRFRLAAALFTAAVVGMPCAASATPPATAPAFEPASRPASGRADFRIGDDRITESSGLALSIRHPHTVWTVNDSGDSARVFAVDTNTGKTVGVHTFDADVRDVEALAITPQGQMLVADIGDNESARKFVRVFWFDEPALGTTSGAWASWELSYPDGPHNAEALAVDPTSGRILVVTKEVPGGIYALPASPSRRGLNRLTRVGTAPGMATDAVFLPDGSGLAVRTYTSLVVMDPSSWRVASTQLLPLQPQGETVAVAPGGAGLLVGSEGRSSRVIGVTVAGRHGGAPSSAGTPSTTASTGTPAGTPAGTVAGTASRRDPRADAASPSAHGGELLAGLGVGAGLLLLGYLVARLPRRGRR